MGPRVSSGGSGLGKEALGRKSSRCFSVGGGRIMGQDSLGLEMAWDAHGLQLNRRAWYSGLFAGFIRGAFFIGGFGVLRCLS